MRINDCIPAFIYNSGSHMISLMIRRSFLKIKILNRKMHIFLAMHSRLTQCRQITYMKWIINREMIIATVMVLAKLPFPYTAACTYYMLLCHYNVCNGFKYRSVRSVTFYPNLIWIKVCKTRYFTAISFTVTDECMDLTLTIHSLLVTDLLLVAMHVTISQILDG